ncbi:MAG: hypothetical protein WAQ98_32465 [Blastocatellia bacterium]
MTSINDTKVILENIMMMALQHVDENKGLGLIEDLGSYLADNAKALDKSVSLLIQEFDLGIIDKNIPVITLLGFCIDFIDIKITECEKVLPPLVEREMLLGKNLEIVEIYNRAEMIKSRLGNHFRSIYKGQN